MKPQLENFSPAFLESVSSLNIEPKKLDKILIIIDNQYNKNIPQEYTEPPHSILKFVLKTMRFMHTKKLSRFSDPFLAAIMDVSPSKDQLHNLLDIVDKNYPLSPTDDLVINEKLKRKFKR